MILTNEINLDNKIHASIMKEFTFPEEIYC